VREKTRLGLFITAANNLMHVPGPLTQAQVDAIPIRRTQRTCSATSGGTIASAARGDVDTRRERDVRCRRCLFVNPQYIQRSERNVSATSRATHFGGSVMARRPDRRNTRSVITLGCGRRLPGRRDPVSNLSRRRSRHDG
jgi:hypothetical protein